MALVGNMIADAKGGNPSVVNYTMFVSVFAMLTLFYLIAATISEGLGGHPMLMLAVDALNTLFFLIGGIALAGYLNVHSCNNTVCVPYVVIPIGANIIQVYTTSNGITNGSDNTEKRCREAQATCAFLWFGFAAFLGSLAFSAVSSRSGTAIGRGGVGSIRRGGPSMSQV